MIITNKNFYIYDQVTAEEFLINQGIESWQVHDFKEFLCSEVYSFISEQAKKIDNYEKEAEYLNECLNEMQNELLYVADNLASGKGGTKIQYADRIKKIVNRY